MTVRADEIFAGGRVNYRERPDAITARPKPHRVVLSVSPTDVFDAWCVIKNIAFAQHTVELDDGTLRTTVIVRLLCLPHGKRGKGRGVAA